MGKDETTWSLIVNRWFHFYSIKAFNQGSEVNLPHLVKFKFLDFPRVKFF